MAAMIFAIIHGPYGFEIDRVCAEDRDEIRAYVEHAYPDASAISWTPTWIFNTADGYGQRFLYRHVHAPGTRRTTTEV